YIAILAIMNVQALSLIDPMKQDAARHAVVGAVHAFRSNRRQVSREKEKARGPGSPGRKEPRAPDWLADCAGRDYLWLRAACVEAWRVARCGAPGLDASPGGGSPDEEHRDAAREPQRPENRPRIGPVGEIGADVSGPCGDEGHGQSVEQRL